MLLTNQTDSDRRRDVRLASGAGVEAVVVDSNNRPTTVLRNSQVLDVSARGLCVMTDTAVPAGARVTFEVPSIWSREKTHDRFTARVVRCESDAHGGNRLGCELATGRMPATLIYKFESR